ncbi:MAG: error-prone DNA polymerase [Acidobacteriota bacterium]|nr:MAG: error-prone DNA polymerase [Acidobacteriota bacterium]
MSYCELHIASSFSFLEGSSNPEQLAETAAHLEYPAAALLDRDGVYGAPRFYKACREAGIRPIVGAEITLPEGQLPLLVQNRTGYQNLCQLITSVKLENEKGKGIASLETLEEFSSGLICLTGGVEGPLWTLLEETPLQAQPFIDRLQQIYGPHNVYVEIQRHFDRKQESFTQQCLHLASRTQLPVIATNGVRYSSRSGRLLHDVLTCIRHRTHLDQAGKLLNRNSERYLKSPGEMTKLFSDIPRALFNTLELTERLDFTLENLGYEFPDYPCPAGESMASYLRQLAHAGARRRYRPYQERARRQIEHELHLIEKLDLSGYFLIVWDLVQFCQRNDILVQGRGSAANSAVCYSLGITAVDPVGMELLFERFLSEERGEWPDIDLDLPSGEKREKVIQYIYERYGRCGAAMTANVISYRGRSAAREVGKALNIPQEQLDKLSKLLSSYGYSSQDNRTGSREEIDGIATTEGQRVLMERAREIGLELSGRRARAFIQLWQQIQNLPRRLGQHSGGMVICRGRLDRVVPLENARMPGRSVVQWDKDDCAHLGIIKVDLLGLGMMAAIHESLELVRQSGTAIDLAHLPPDDPKVYSMLQAADTVGVFQVESRAQMATLPRLRPTRFYDLVVQIAIIRPGPIVGDMVHPYLGRRSGREPVTYPHPSLEPILKRTLGVPLFQEQLLRIAMVAANFTGGEAEELRRALGFKRPDQAMNKIEEKLRQGLRNNGITGEKEELIVKYITSFALYGFPESHAASFALLAYASAYLKAHHPAEFYTALLNNQPMGFYHPATLIKDAQHRHQRVRPIDVCLSDWRCRIEPDRSIRLGLMYARGLREASGIRIEQERQKCAFQSVDDFQQRAELNRAELNTLARIGALNSFGMRRREALWQVERSYRFTGPLLKKLPSPPDPSPLREMNAVERLLSDYAGSKVTTGPHPMSLLRKYLVPLGVLQSCHLPKRRSGEMVRVAGSVIVRQRPMTAKGFLFVSLEDETGISNIIVRPQMFERDRLTLMSQPFLIFEGVLQNQDSVISVRAERVQPFPSFPLEIEGHDFH